MSFSPLRKIAEQILGGMGDNKPDRLFIRKQLREGIKVEKEHTPSKSKAKEIAKDHLTEHPKYYSALKKMEDRLKKKAVYMSRSGKGSDAEHTYDYESRAEASRNLDADLRGNYLGTGGSGKSKLDKKQSRKGRSQEKRPRSSEDVPQDTNSSEGDAWSSDNELRN